MSSSDQSRVLRPAGAGGARAEAAALARVLVRAAWKGALGTVARDGGHPYGSLVAVACEPGGAPILLLSGLAEHTKNLAEDQRASLLIDGTETGPAALTGARVTLVGRIAVTASPIARRRYRERHPDAAGFIDFADFKLYGLQIEWAHLVAGFGRIVRLEAAEITVRTDDAAALVEAEPGVLQHMNEDHGDAIALLAQQMQEAAGREPRPSESGVSGRWRMIGCDPEGIDLARGADALRLQFSQRITTPDAVRQELVDMVRAARSNHSRPAANPGS